MVLYDISYANISLYLSVLPTYNSKKDKDKSEQKQSGMSFGGLLGMLKKTGNGKTTR